MSDTKPILCRLCKAEPNVMKLDETRETVYCRTNGCAMRIGPMSPDCWNALNAPSEDERRMDYLTHRVKTSKPGQALVMAQDGTMCWADTYRQAVDKAMAHDGWEGKE